MPNPSKPGNSNRPNPPNRPNRDDKQGQPEFQPVEQSADTELEEAEREDEQQGDPRVDNPGINDPAESDEAPVQVSGEDFGDEDEDEAMLAGEEDAGGIETDEDDDQSLGAGPGGRSKRSRQDSDRLRP